MLAAEPAGLALFLSPPPCLELPKARVKLTQQGPEGANKPEVGKKPPKGKHGALPSLAVLSAGLLSPPPPILASGGLALSLGDFSGADAEGAAASQGRKGAQRTGKV